MGVAADGVMPGVIPDIPDGVILSDGVMPPGVIPPIGVMPPGVALGVAAPGVTPPALGVALGVAPGVSSHRERRLLADGVGVSEIIFSSTLPLSVLGVSAQPAPCPGVSLSVRGVSSHLFRLPGVAAPT